LDHWKKDSSGQRASHETLIDAARQFECTPAPQSLQTCTARSFRTFFVEVGMATDSTSRDNMQRRDQLQDCVPSKPEPDSPSLNPDDPGKYDPLTTPDPATVQRPEDWDDSTGRKLPEADEQTPLSDDRR
jgi:hypothetical protein